jgi:hypothetical protein
MSINATQYRINIESLASAIQYAHLSAIQINADGTCFVGCEHMTADELAKRLDNAVAAYYEDGV